VTLCVPLVRSDVSEERIASIIWVKEFNKVGYVSSNLIVTANVSYLVDSFDGHKISRHYLQFSFISMNFNEQSVHRLEYKVEDQELLGTGFRQRQELFVVSTV
jgi:hypothetical protein